MKNISHKNKWNTGTLQVHVEPSLVPLIKSKKYEQPGICFVKIKLRRYPTSEKSDLYEFKMASFDNGNTEKFLLFIRNFNMTIEVSGTILAGAKNQ